MRPRSDEPPSRALQNALHRCPDRHQQRNWRPFMKNRTHAWMAAAAVTMLMQVLLFTVILPRPAAATDRAFPPAPSDTAGRADPLVARGKYLAAIAGCHDCHSEGYAE